MYGFYRIAVCVPELKVADTAFNTAEIIRCAGEAEAQGAAGIVFPELSITGASCGDLFFQHALLNEAENCMNRIAGEFRHSSLLIVLGLPLLHQAGLYNCAAWLQQGKVLAFTPKTFLPGVGDVPDKRWFADGRDLLERPCHYVKGTERIPFAPQIQTADGKIRIGAGFGWDCSCFPLDGTAAVPPVMMFDLAASKAVAGQRKIVRNGIKSRSLNDRNLCVYVSAGVHESTTDGVCEGVAMIAENGNILAENKGFSRQSEILYADADLEALCNPGLNPVYQSGQSARNENSQAVSCSPLRQIDELQYRSVNSLPFLPDPLEKDEFCREILQIQCAGLAKRLEVTGSTKTVIGVSGGLDSTLALLVLRETYTLLGLDPRNIVAVSMPGFGTSSRTKGNSVSLSELLGTDARTVDICPACLQHFQDIGHDPAVLDVTYENVQARERTQILMDIANRERGLVIGTGDLTEIALGWSTYNGDHMSMYSVNAGVPKTLIRYLVSWYAHQHPGELAQVLLDIVDTPVSPELLPIDKSGKIAQKTESILGAYELHDFYLYHFVRTAAEPAKIRFLAKYAFAGKYPDEEIDRTLKLFLRRFFTQQFKRSCMPDGPQVGVIGLSPRGSWCMPSDASMALWLQSLGEPEGKV